MADKRQSKQEASRKPVRGGGQAVVSLCKVSESGLVFWSRSRFELAAELQVRLRREVLPRRLRERLNEDGGGWSTVRGFVVECSATRKADGSALFRVSLVLDPVLNTTGARGDGPLPRLHVSGIEASGIFGLN